MLFWEIMATSFTKISYTCSNYFNNGSTYFMLITVAPHADPGSRKSNYRWLIRHKLIWWLFSFSLFQANLRIIKRNELLYVLVYRLAEKLYHPRNQELWSFLNIYCSVWEGMWIYFKFFVLHEYTLNFVVYTWLKQCARICTRDVRRKFFCQTMGGVLFFRIR